MAAYEWWVVDFVVVPRWIPGNRTVNGRMLCGLPGVPL